VAHVPTSDGHAWYSGATFERNNASTEVSVKAHDHNFERLSQLLPAIAGALTVQWQDQASLNAWVGVRCASVNRLPRQDR